MLNPIPIGLVPISPDIDITGKSDADCFLILGQMVRGGLLKCFLLYRGERFEDINDLAAAHPTGNGSEVSVIYEVIK
jgi:hypothetical protein